MKNWTVSEIRTLARQTVDGRMAVVTARGNYFRALVESAQAELATRSGEAGQMAAVKAVHRRFYPVVQEATTTPDIRLDKKVPMPERKRRALERNRRTNFARSAYGTIRRWLRDPSHDLMKLDASKVTKSQLLNEAPPAGRHTMTPHRIRSRGSRLTRQLVDYAKQIAKLDQAEASAIIEAAIQQLTKLVAANAQASAATRRATVRLERGERRAA